MIIKLALAYIKSTKDKLISIASYLSMISLALSIATLIVVMSVMQGFANQTLAQMLAIQGHITISGAIHNYPAIIQQIQHPDIIDIQPLLEQQVVINHNNQITGVLLHGLISIPISTSTTPSPISTSTTPPIIIQTPYPPLTIGKKLAEHLDLKQGDTVQLLNPAMISTPFGTSPIMETFIIHEIKTFGINQYDRILCTANLQDVQQFLELDNVISTIIIKIKHPFQSKSIAIQLQKQFPQYQVQTWQETNHDFTQLLSTQRKIMMIIISLMILMAGFNGISSLMMLVREKTHDIAILLAIGCKKHQIILVFLTIGLILSIISIIIGTIIGILIAKNINHIKNLLEYILHIDLFPADFYSLHSLPIHLDYTYITTLALCSFITILLGILYPCIQATNLNLHQQLREQ